MKWSTSINKKIQNKTVYTVPLNLTSMGSDPNGLYRKEKKKKKKKNL